MTSLPDRPHTALLVIDAQNAVLADAHQRDVVVGNIAALVARARAQGAPVVWVQNADDEHLVRGTKPWQIIAELRPYDGEPLVHKRYGDSFEETELESLLAGHRVGHVVVTGAETDACVRATLHGALFRGYDTTLVSDAHTTQDQSAWGAPPPAQVIAHTNLYWQYEVAPGRRGATVTTQEADFRAPV